ncbi:TIGR01906 family membrane protein [Chloroflexota bacterium]
MVLKILRILASVLFVVCIPIVLVTSNGRGVINTPRLYEYGYDKYNVADATGLEKAELMHIAEELIIYFNSPGELSVADDFNGREVTHLADVKNLIGLFSWIQEACLMYVIGYIFMGYYFLKRKWWPMLAKRLIWSSALTLGIFAALGIALAVNFDGLFTWFHEAGFSNTLWLMLPSDLLTKLYPQSFFFDVSLFVVIAVVIECVLMGGISAGHLIYRKRKSVATVATGGGAGTTSV